MDNKFRSEQDFKKDLLLSSLKDYFKNNAEKSNWCEVEGITLKIDAKEILQMIYYIDRDLFNEIKEGVDENANKSGE